MVGTREPECIPCRTHAGSTPVTPLVYSNFEGWRTPEVQRSKGPCVEITILLRQYAKEHRLSYIHAATPIGKLTPRRKFSGLSAWNAPWLVCKLFARKFFMHRICWAAILASKLIIFYENHNEFFLNFSCIYSN